MIISKEAQKDYRKCEDDNTSIQCEDCHAEGSISVFEICEIMKYAEKERVWVCHKCKMLGNYEEFTDRGGKHYCNRCNSDVEEIVLE